MAERLCGRACGWLSAAARMGDAMRETTQLDLLLPPRSHTHDPSTSHEAEAATTVMRGRHARVVLQLVADYPLATSTELADYAQHVGFFSIDPHRRLYQVRRRLSDLRIAGLVAIVGRRDHESIWLRQQVLDVVAALKGEKGSQLGARHAKEDLT